MKIVTTDISSTLEGTEKSMRNYASEYPAGFFVVSAFGCKQTFNLAKNQLDSAVEFWKSLIPANRGKITANRIIK